MIAAAVAERVPMLGDREFAAYRDLIYREAGIHLSAVKKALVVARLSRRLRELGLSSFRDHLALVDRDGLERRLLLEAICTHETSFFREPKHFEHLGRVALPELRASCRPRTVRAFSAGCSSGEEPFSIAMTLSRGLPADEGWGVEVMATDLSLRVLDRARAAQWPIERARQIPPALLKEFMLQGVGPREGTMRAGTALRALVRFQQLNLNDALWPPLGEFDFVFCRNVLIYFDAASKAQVVARLIDRLAPGGLFFIGHAETLGGVTDRVRCILPTVYGHRA